MSMGLTKAMGFGISIILREEIERKKMVRIECSQIQVNEGSVLPVATCLETPRECGYSASVRHRITGERETVCLRAC